jgi:hypothetical protein
VDIRWDNYVGRDLDGFSLLTLLGVRDGRGFFLTTRRGEDVLLQAVASDGAQLERWRRAATLSHPHLNEILTAGEAQFTDDEPAISYAISPIPDDDLGEQLGRGAFDTKAAGSLLTATATALDYLHGRGLVHGAVTPQNIFFARGTVRLAADTVAPGTDDERREDIRQLGKTLRRALAGSDTDQRLQPVLEGMESGDEEWSAGRVLQALAEPLTPPAPPPRREPAPPVIVPPPAAVVEPPSASPSHAWGWISAVAVVVIGLALFVGARSRRGETPSPTPPQAAQADKPAMFGEPAAPPPVVAPPPATRTRSAPPQANAPAHAGWAVIAATYGAYQGAEKRASAIRNRWPQFQPVIYPRSGEGRRYYVVLGSGLTKDQASDLHRRARQAGMPGDTYVTKLGG